MSFLNFLAWQENRLRSEEAQYGLDRINIPFVREHLAGHIAKQISRDMGVPFVRKYRPISEIWADIAAAFEPEKSPPVSEAVDSIKSRWELHSGEARPIWEVPTYFAQSFLEIDTKRGEGEGAIGV